MGGQLSDGTLLESIYHLSNLKSGWKHLQKILSKPMRSPAAIIWSKLSAEVMAQVEQCLKACSSNSSTELLDEWHLINLCRLIAMGFFKR